MREFLRKMTLSAVVTACIIFGFAGACKAYTGIRRIGFGEHRSAIEFKDGAFSFFDYKF